MAGWQGWSATDLVWSLWISSLLVGYAFLALHVFAGAPEDGPARGLRILGGLFTLGFFTVHFGGFHFVHSVFLNEFFPLTGGSSDAALTAAAPWWWASLVGEAVRRYWPFLLATVLSRRGTLRRAVDDEPDGRSTMMGPYGNVLRMHVLIFVFAGLQAAGLTGYAVYPVLFFYFFPLGALKELWTGALAG